jgi:hypothetical protein
MSTSVDTAFTQKYLQEVKVAYQREGSLLRGAVRNRTVEGAERVYFPKLGKGVATTKARHADVNPMNLEHTRVFADMEDYYAPEYIDDLDQAKTNWTIRSEYVRQSANALGRQTDNIILTAMDAATNSTSADAINPTTNTALTRPVINRLSKRLTERDVPMDRRRYAVIGPDELEELLAVDEAVSSDFSRQQLLNTGSAPAFWFGFNWIVHTGMPSGVKGFFFHQDSFGLGVNADMKGSVDWVPEKVAHLVNAWMSMGAVIIDNDGVEKLTA